MSNSAIGGAAKVATLNITGKETKIATSIWPSANGTLLVLMELNLAPNLAQDFIADLTRTIEKYWTHLPEQDSPADQLLEKLLTNLNFILESKKRLMGNPLAPRYHLAVALLQSDNLVLSTVGRVNALLIADDKINNIVNQSGRPNSKPTFEQITSGQLEPGDSFVLASTCLLDYFSADKLHRTLNSQNPGAALRLIEKYMDQLPHPAPLGVIALRFGSLTPSANLASSPSLDKLIDTESATSKLLKPQLWDYLKNLVSQKIPKPKIPNILPKSVAPNRVKINQSEPDEQTYIPTNMVTTEENPLPRPPLAPKTTLKNKYESFNTGLQKFLVKLSWLRSRESAKNALASWLGQKIKNWRKLKLSKKIIFILAGLLLTAFSTSIISLGRDKLNLKDSELYNQLVTSITEQQAGLEAALIYHDDNKASAYLKDIEQLLNKLPRNSSSRQAQYQALNEHLTSLKNRLQRKADIKNPTKVAKLPENQSWLGLNLSENSLLTYNAAGQLYSLGLEGQTNILANLPSELTGLKTAYLNNQGNLMIFQGNNDRLALISNNKSQVNLINNPPRLISGSWYDNKFYYLDDENKTIFRSLPQGNQLNSTRWLRTSQGQLTDAVDLSVDGSIYVITPNSLKKYHAGLLNDFSTPNINPPLQNLSKVSTQIDSDYVILFSRADQRLIIINKQGQLVIQLYFPDLINLQDFSFDNKNKIIYLLSIDGNVYQVDIASYLN